MNFGQRHVINSFMLPASEKLDANTGRFFAKIARSHHFSELFSKSAGSISLYKCFWKTGKPLMWFHHMWEDKKRKKRKKRMERKGWLTLPVSHFVCWILKIPIKGETSLLTLLWGSWNFWGPWERRCMDSNLRLSVLCLLWTTLATVISFSNRHQGNTTPENLKTDCPQPRLDPYLVSQNLARAERVYLQPLAVCCENVS